MKRRDFPGFTNLNAMPGIFYRLYLGTHKSKTEGYSQIHSTLTTLGSIALLLHPSRLNMSYNLNVNVCKKRHKIVFKNNPGKKNASEVKGPLTFFPGASSTVT